MIAVGDADTDSPSARPLRADPLLASPLSAGWLRDDGVAAISVWALLVPQALAYATIAGVPVQYGLYTAFAGLIAYAIFGTSRQVVQGPSATVAAVSTVVITPLAGAAAIGTDAAAPWAAALALVTGAVYLACGFLRLGWISNFISRAVLAGFIFGFALGIIIDQSPKVLGVSVGEGSYAEELVHVLGELGNISLSTLAVGAACLAVLLPLRYRKPGGLGRSGRRPRPPPPRQRSTSTTTGSALTGDVPTGLFSVGIPDVDAGDIGKLAVGAVSVVFVGFAETLAAGRTMASRALVRDRRRPGARRPGRRVWRRRFRRRVRERRQPLEDLGGRRGRASAPRWRR